MFFFLFYLYTVFFRLVFICCSFKVCERWWTTVLNAKNGIPVFALTPNIKTTVDKNISLCKPELPLHLDFLSWFL